MGEEKGTSKTENAIKISNAKCAMSNAMTKQHAERQMGT